MDLVDGEDIRLSSNVDELEKKVVYRSFRQETFVIEMYRSHSE